MIVADSNLLAYLLIPGERSEAADRVFRRDPEWASPLLCRSELRNVLALYMRKEGLLLTQAQKTMAKAEEILRDREYAVPSGDVLSLASSHRVTAYDAEFVVLARMLGAPLVTFDEALLRAFPAVAVDPLSFGGS